MYMHVIYRQIHNNNEYGNKNTANNSVTSVYIVNLAKLAKENQQKLEEEAAKLEALFSKV